MSMNLFFKAFNADQIEAMAANKALIDDWILKDKRFADAIDVETAWDVLQTALNGCGFKSDIEVDHALFNGCSLVSTGSVASQSNEFKRWTEDRLLEAVSKIDPAADLYHAETWTDEDGQDELLEHFANLKGFFAKAAAQGWGMVVYAA